MWVLSVRKHSMSRAKLAMSHMSSEPNATIYKKLATYLETTCAPNASAFATYLQVHKHMPSPQLISVFVFQNN